MLISFLQGWITLSGGGLQGNLFEDGLQGILMCNGSFYHLPLG